MEISGDIKNLITQSKNICLIPFENEPESLSASLALFYTLKELGKNVNLISENFPEKLNFLVPSVDFISSPKNFVISIPRSVADVSQIYYEKTDESLKIHLTADKSNIKKENISFYFQDAKPDLIVTLGIRDFKKHMESKLDSFGFLLSSPILNIDNKLENSRFGQANLIEQKSLSEITLNLIKFISENFIAKNTATCLLAGLTIYYENFKSRKTGQNTFEIASELIKSGADNQLIIDNLHKTSEKEISFLGKLFKNLKQEENLSVAILDQAELGTFSESEINFAIEKVKDLGIYNDLLVLWESNASEPVIKGFFCSKNLNSLKRIADNYSKQSKDDWVFLLLPRENINSVKESILKLLK